MSRHDNRTKHIRLVKSTKNTVDIKQYQLKSDEKKVLSRKIKECELKLCMLLVELNLPMVLTDHLPKLLKSAVPDSDIIKGINCSRTKTTCLLKNFQEESERTLSEILQGRKFSLIVDETTYISIQKCLAVVTRYTDIPNESVRDRLLSLVVVQDLSADGIVNKILDILEKMSIPIQNLIGFAADNAAVMMGKYNGVQARLKQLNENAQLVVYVPHYIYVQVLQQKKLPNEIEYFLCNIYNYLNCSSKRLQEYKKFQEFVCIKPHKLLKPSQTRWLSLEAVVRRTLEQ